MRLLPFLCMFCRVKVSENEKLNIRKGVIVKVLKNIGSTEILVLAGIMMLMFGGRKLPEFAKGVGDAVKEFKRAAKE